MTEALHIAAASVDVTPQSPVPMAGYIGRDKPFTAIHDPLEMNALRLVVDGRSVVFITLDTLSFSKELEDHCRACIPPGVDAHVFGIASHTHFAPALDAHLNTLGEVDAAYRKFVFTQAERLMAALFAKALEPARIMYGAAKADHCINRRRRAWRPNLRQFPPIKKVMCLLPNPAGLRDETLRALRLETPEGKPLAVMWSYKCHPVGFPEDGKISADYPGAVRSSLRKTMDTPGLPVLFLSGFAGNMRPNTIARVKSPIGLLRYMLQGPYFGPFSKNRWQGWCSSLADTVTRALDHTRAVPVPPTLTVTETVLPYSVVQHGDAPEGRPEPTVAQIRFGDVMSFLILNGEPVIELRDVLGNYAPSLLRMCIGYRGHMFGYWPTSALLKEGGYEADGFRPAFALTGKYHADIDDRVRAALG